MGRLYPQPNQNLATIHYTRNSETAPYNISHVVYILNNYGEIVSLFRKSFLHGTCSVTTKMFTTVVASEQYTNTVLMLL